MLKNAAPVKPQPDAASPIKGTSINDSGSVYFYSYKLQEAPLNLPEGEKG